MKQLSKSWRRVESRAQLVGRLTNEGKTVQEVGDLTGRT